MGADNDFQDREVLGPGRPDDNPRLEICPIDAAKRQAEKLRDVGPLVLLSAMRSSLAEQDGGPKSRADFSGAAMALGRILPPEVARDLIPVFGQVVAGSEVDWRALDARLGFAQFQLEDQDSREAVGVDLSSMTAAALLAEDLPPREDVLGNILPVGGLGLLAGAPKSGKTLLALALAVAVVRGERFLEFPTRQGPVLILSGEGGPQLLRERLLKMAGDDRRGLDRLHLWWPKKCNLRLDVDEDRAGLVEACKKLKVSLLVVDPMIRFHALDENSTKDMAALMACLAEIRQATGAACLLVHHRRKAARDSKTGSVQEARGSSVLHGEIDAGLLLERRRSSGDFTLHAELRWAAEPAPMLLALDEETLRFTVAAHLEGGTRKVPETAVLHRLQTGEGTVRQVMADLGVSNGTCRGYLADLKRKGLADFREGPRKTQVWFATDGRDLGDEQEELPF